MRKLQLAGENLKTEDECLVQIDYVHAKLHEGELFMASYFASSVAAAGSLVVQITPGTISPHLYLDVATGANAQVQLVEGGSIAAPAGTILAYNRQRGDSATALATVTRGTTSAGGTAIFSMLIPGGSRQGAVGGQGRADNEIVLQPSVPYTVVVTNISESAAAVGVGLRWYEENE